MKVVNSEDTPIGDITAQMLERRALPIGRKEFEEWSDRIIAGANVQASTRSLKFSLAAMLLHLGPTEAYKSDGFLFSKKSSRCPNGTCHAYRDKTSSTT